jgi:1,4-alpha-glucan branching enzyme/glycosyltransferase involved in cell wall biosynthesis
MAIPDMFIKLLKECTDDGWGMGHICHTLTNRRYKEGVIAYCESHDQAIVGDKSIAFWLMDAEMYTGMSCLQPASMCVERGLALHKMIRMLVLGLGGEGYLNFIGNEFGHPEWVDFPREGNDWSYHHCRRRFDLPDMDHLRYKYFEKFDILMQQAENRFGWCSSEHQYVSVKNEMDKVIVFERGDCLFVFNFHHSNSYADYGVGCCWNEPMRVVLDSDEGWFGGHHRLDWGHSNGIPPQDGLHSRNHSVKLYLPARTCQVLVRESLLKGGVKIKLSSAFLAEYEVKASDLTLIMEDGNSAVPTKDGIVHFAENWNATFMIKNKVDSSKIPCMGSVDEMYRVYFPGNYMVDGLGVVEVVRGEGFPVEEAPVARASVIKKMEVSPPTVQGGTVDVTFSQGAMGVPVMSGTTEKVMMMSPEKVDPDAKCSPKPSAEKFLAEPPKPKPVEQPKVASYEPPKPAPEPPKPVAEPPKPVVEPPKPAEPPKPVEAPKQQLAEAIQQVKVEEQKNPIVYDKDPDAGEDAHPLRRLGSGCHLSSVPVEEPGAASGPSLDGLPTSYKEEMQTRRTLMSQAVTAMGDGGLLSFARSYSSFGLHYTASKNTWSYIEWIPNATEVYLMGDFNHWSRTTVPLRKDAKSDLWGGVIDSTLARGLVPGTKYKVHVVPCDGEPFDCMPAWCRQVVKTPDTGLLDAVVPDKTDTMASSFKCWKDGAELRIYEVHVAMAKGKDKGASFAEVQSMLPRIARDGYTAILLIGVSNADENCPLATKNKNMFAPEYRFGNAEEVKKLIKVAHDLGIRMIMSVDHSTTACTNDSIPSTRYLTEKTHLFDYEEMEVLRVLLGNIAYWMEEFGFDGFRFKSVQTMLYNHQGRWPPQDHEKVEEYVTGNNENNRAGVRYLMLANELVRALGGVSIAEESTLYPGLCDPTASCGLGFHFRQTTSANDIFQQFLRTKKDEDWGMTELVDALRYAKYYRPEEKILSCTESFEDCCLGMRPLRIAMFSWETLHTIAAGGVAPHVTELAADLHKLGHEVHIFTRSTQPRTWEHEIMGVWYHEVTFDTSPDFVREIENMCGALAGACREYEGRSGKMFDVFHGHDWLAAKACVQIKQGNRKVIFTMHSTETGRCGNQAFGGQSARIREIEGEGCHIADRVICVSGVLADEVKRYYGVGHDKIRVVYNGIIADGIINMPWEDEWTGNTKKDKGFSVMDPVFLFVGRLAVQKGPDLLIEAIPMILNCRGDAKFIIVGDGHMKGALEARVNQLGIGHAVKFTGSVKSGSAHLKALFKACDAVIVPSRNEPFGIVVLEAWAAGKPVVATTSGGPRDFVTPGQDGFLVDPEPGSISWGCCEILNDFERAQRMGKGAQGKALHQFSWYNIACQTHDLYYEQLGLLGTPFNSRPDTGCPLSAHLLGNCRHQMGVFCDDIIADRGINLLKLTRLLVTSFGNDASLTCMGSEFGFPDSLDARLHTSDSNSRIRYEEADEKGLRYKHIELWEACINRVSKLLKWHTTSDVEVLVQDDNAKVLAYSRGPCLFAFNFHPANEQAKYKIRFPGGSTGTELMAVLDSDDPRFNGKSRGATSVKVEKDKYVTLDLAPRTAVVLASKDAPGVSDLPGDKVLSVATIDDFVDLLESTKKYSPPARK